MSKRASKKPGKSAVTAFATSKPPGVAKPPKTVPASGAIRTDWFSSSHGRWLLGILLVVGTLLAYQPAWHAGFIWDDDVYVTQNHLLTAPDGLWRIWFTLDSPSQYFPLVYTVFRIEHGLWGLNATGYHWGNLLLHVCNALLLWKLLSRLNMRGAWLAAAIFALHPVQVESVAWITELKNVLSLFCCLMAGLQWVNFVKDESRSSSYWLALLFQALALFSKTTACTLPVALLLVVWWQGKRIDSRRIVQMIPFLLVSLAMGLVTIWWERYHQGTQGPMFAIPLLDRLLVASRAVWFYLGKLLWPANLMFSYPQWTIRPTDPLAYSWLAAAITFAGLLYFKRQQLNRGIMVALLFFVVTLSPLLGFIMLYTFRYTFVADHYQYAASVGPIALAAAGLTMVLDQNHRLRFFIKPFVCALLLVTLGSLTWRQSRIYKNQEILWRVTLERNPTSSLAENNFGVELMNQGQLDEAIAHYRKAVELRPDENSHANLGYGLLQKGRFDEAIAEFEKSLQIWPQDPEAQFDLALALEKAGRGDEALERYQMAVTLLPDNADAHRRLADLLRQRGRMPEAVAEYGKAIEIRPDDAQAHSDLGMILANSGRIDDAIQQYRLALRIQPGSAGILEGLGHCLLIKGEMNEAINQFQSALAIQPTNISARTGLGLVLMRENRVDEAITNFQSVLRLNGNDAPVHVNLGFALMSQGKYEDAAEHFKMAAGIQPGYVAAQLGLADVMVLTKQFPEATRQYNAVLSQEPDNLQVLCNLARLLATSGDASIRDGPRALDLAQKANQLTGNREPAVLEILAAAYAETGKFPNAIDSAKRALDLADARKDAALALRLRSELALYATNSPYHDPSLTSAK